MSLYLGTTPIANNSVSRNIGEIIQSTIPLSDAGLHLLDGALINGAGSYAKFVTYIAGLVSNYPDLFTTEAAWQQSVTDYGVCGKFVYDSVNNTVRLPKITGFVEGTTDVTALGDLVEAGLPNITGNFYNIQQARSNQASGAFTYITYKNIQNTSSGGDYWQEGNNSFDASRSTSIYGNSNTVQPQSIKVLYYIVIASSITNELNLDVADMATKSLDNLDNTGKNIANWSNNVTNCITEIPQDIKLELNNGTLTLKAGSKVYVPNGFTGTTPKFDKITIQSDVSVTNTASGGDSFVYYLPSANTLVFSFISGTGSGTTTPSSGVYYNTSINQIGVASSGSLTDKRSFPIAIVQRTGSISSIDQVFNGFGYIGSTVFALPGVKGLIPNGRNADGTLNNIEASVSSVSLLTLQSSITLKGKGRFLLNDSGGIFARVGSYDENNNYVLGGNGIEKIYGCVFADNCTVTSGVIETLNTKTAFHAVDYNDSSWVAQQAMPSSRYINLTLGATGATYTAPANGWFTINKHGTDGKLAAFENITAGGVTWISCLGGETDCRISCPAKKGDNVKLWYNATGTTNFFRFVYAEGEN